MRVVEGNIDEACGRLGAEAEANLAPVPSDEMARDPAAGPFEGEQLPGG